MGTAVAQAICTDCARVARTEADFCDHMRRKSCYGEINIGLNPIELSIVVNGADPRASIKHIVAAANSMNEYLDVKQKELEKFAQQSFHANLNFSAGDPDDSGAVTNINVSSKDLDTFRKDVDKAIEEYQKIQSSLSNEENMVESGNDPASNKLSDASDTPTADNGLAPPHARFAGIEVDTVTELYKVTKAIETKLNQLKTSLDRLNASTNNNTQEENMSGTNMNKQGYFQGAGGVNEPTPGQAKYPKDPLNEKLRDTEDKQMVGQNGFPGVGPVDGMHPSPVSADQKDELERKKLLARADLEDRAMRRQAIVELAKKALEDKRGYFQNGLEKGNVNTPTPGQVKYPIDKLNEQLRDHEDKQMVGQKPFPGVGNVDGLHPSPSSADPADELKRKELLRRASLRARFVKANNDDGTQNFAKSAWEVFLGDKLLLTASVGELSGGNVAGLYDSIATKDFGARLIEKVKKDGAEKVASLFKRAQAAPPPPPDSSAPPSISPDDAGPPPPPDAPMGKGKDKGGDGDPKKDLVQLSDKMRDLASDMGEAARALTGEQAEMGKDEGADAMPPDLGTSASFSTSTMNNLRRELNGALLNALKESIAELDDRQQELGMIAGLYDKGAVNQSNNEFVGTICDDATTEAKSVIADGFKLMTAFVKYARGTQAIVKRAEIEAELASLAVDGDSNMTSKHDSSSSDDDLLNLMQSADADIDAVNSLLADDSDDIDEASLFEGAGIDANDATVALKPGELVPTNLPAGSTMEVKQASLDTKEGRAALRAKLAGDATGKEDDGDVEDMSKAKFSDMLQEADHLADGQTQLDTKPSDDLGLVETLPEQNKAMLEVAKAPPKVRKEAEAINNLVKAGQLDPKDLDALVAEGLDKDAVSYWKKYYGQTDGGSEFASELVKEHVKAQLEEQLNKFRVKMARAYELAYDMVDRGLCHNDRATISDQVDQIMKFNDDAFDSLKRVVAKHDPVLRKESGRMAQVGMIGSGEVNTVQADEGNLYSELSAAFSKTSKRTF
jgi:hypothetical protein